MTTFKRFKNLIAILALAGAAYATYLAFKGVIGAALFLNAIADIGAAW